jgi:plasmid stabilization system protein ParE
MSPTTPLTTPTWSSNGSSPPWNDSRTTRALDVSYPELGDESIREVIHGNYRIVYRLRHDVVEIATVFHGARLFRLD